MRPADDMRPPSILLEFDPDFPTAGYGDQPVDEILRNKKLTASFMTVLSEAGVTAADAAAGTSLPSKGQVDLLYLVASVYPKNALAHRSALVQLVMTGKIAVRVCLLACGRRRRCGWGRVGRVWPRGAGGDHRLTRLPTCARQQSVRVTRFETRALHSPEAEPIGRGHEVFAWCRGRFP